MVCTSWSKVGFVEPALRTFWIVQRKALAAFSNLAKRNWILFPITKHSISLTFASGLQAMSLTAAGAPISEGTVIVNLSVSSVGMMLANEIVYLLTTPFVKSVYSALKPVMSPGIVMVTFTSKPTSIGDFWSTSTD